MVFNLEKFRSDIRGLPVKPNHRYIRDVLREEENLQQAQQYMDEAENTAATAFHESQGYSLTDGTCVWDQPTERYNSYPANSLVLHLGRMWQNTSTGVSMGEPGASPEWADVTPPPAEEPVPEVEEGE